MGFTRQKSSQSTFAWAYHYPNKYGDIPEYPFSNDRHIFLWAKFATNVCQASLTFLLEEQCLAGCITSSVSCACSFYCITMITGVKLHFMMFQLFTDALIYVRVRAYVSKAVRIHSFVAH